MEDEHKEDDAASILLALKKLKEQLAMPQSDDTAEHPNFRRMWEVLAGDQLEEMLADVDKTKRNLHHPSWRMRLAAISILMKHWRRYDELPPILERMAFEDNHPQVRGTAIFSLACCFRGANNPRIGKLLAGIVQDEDMDESFRRAAYEGLFRLRGVFWKDIPRAGQYRFPDDVDWGFVHSFAAASSPPSEPA